MQQLSKSVNKLNTDNNDSKASVKQAETEYITLGDRNIVLQQQLNAVKVMENNIKAEPAQKDAVPKSGPPKNGNPAKPKALDSPPKGIIKSEPKAQDAARNAMPQSDHLANDPASATKDGPKFKDTALDPAPKLSSPSIDTPAKSPLGNGSMESECTTRTGTDASDFRLNPTPRPASPSTKKSETDPGEKPLPVDPATKPEPEHDPAPDDDDASIGDGASFVKL